MNLAPAPWVFAAKTTALIALLVAFTFNLDQPQWTLLTVFIVAQPQRDSLILAKSFYRIIGTVVGATVALLFVAPFAQERFFSRGSGYMAWTVHLRLSVRTEPDFLQLRACRLHCRNRGLCRRLILPTLSILPPLA